MAEPELEQRLRALPSVDELLLTDPLAGASRGAPRSIALAAARSAVERARSLLRSGESVPALEDLAREAAEEVERMLRPSLRKVVNATGVVVHTNLGRAPLSAAALSAVARAGGGYSNLEYDVEHGRRGSRNDHVERLLVELTGAEAAIAVNNNAAAVMLALAALARGREVVISRGQLVEIGGSFRIPDVLAASGARLVEVGTTNRTRAGDYSRAIGEKTAALMRVHASNFRTVGFTEEASVEELCELARGRGLHMIDDLGSGVLEETLPGGGAPGPERLERLAAATADEPSARRSVQAGADVVCFSADKLLGGPQAGIVVGRRSAVERLRSHPVARAVRIDKLSLAALEATLLVYRDPRRAAEELPVLRMLSAPEAELAARAALIRDRIAGEAGSCVEVTLARAFGRVGGGALPLLELDGPVVSVRVVALGAGELQARLRAHGPPVVARVRDRALLIDPRTMSDDDAELAANAVIAAVA